MTASRFLSLRDFRPRDSYGVTNLLNGLVDVYPNGDQWLERRLEDVLENKATAWVLSDKSDIVRGVAIITPKGANASKLSTIKIDPLIRGNGVGRWLLDEISKFWIRSHIETAHVTVDSYNFDARQFFDRRDDFRKRTEIKSRYGEGRDETVFQWNRDQAENRIITPSVT